MINNRHGYIIYNNIQCLILVYAWLGCLNASPWYMLFGYPSARPYYIWLGCPCGTSLKRVCTSIVQACTRMCIYHLTHCCSGFPCHTHIILVSCMGTMDSFWNYQLCLHTNYGTTKMAGKLSNQLVTPIVRLMLVNSWYLSYFIFNHRPSMINQLLHLWPYGICIQVSRLRPHFRSISTPRWTSSYI